MSTQFNAETLIERSGVSRRDWLRMAAAGFAGSSMSGWLEQLAADTSPTRAVAGL
ncbi:MAG: hypothetical protein ACI93T_001647 [Porticoccaceae bacterium]|jgi:hypothetical protein